MASDTSAATNPAQRSIVIIGKKGAGKSTIANRLSQTSNFPVGCILSRKESWTWNDTVTSPDGTSLVFYMIERIPPELSQKQPASIPPPKNDISLPDQISLVIFVFKYGCFTREEKYFFERIMGSSKDDLRSISALVITGCDDLSEETKKTYIQDFKQDAETKAIASFMQKGIHCVSLPDITKIRAELVQVYQKDIEQSEIEMKALLDSSSQAHPLGSLIKENSNTEPDALIKFFNYCKIKQCTIL